MKQFLCHIVTLPFGFAKIVIEHNIGLITSNYKVKATTIMDIHAMVK